MKKPGIVIILILMTAALFAGPETLKLFSYDESKMNAETMYTYKVSDFEGNNEALFYLYLAGDNKVEYYSDLSSFLPMLYSAKFELNKRYFVADTIKSGNPLGYLKIPNSNNYTTAKINFAEKKINMTATMWDADGNGKSQSYDISVPMWPTYNVGLWYFDFGLAMRHFQGTKQDKFRIGNMYGGNAWDSDVSFEKEEVVNGVLCDKWVVQGRGILARLLGVKQEIWFAKESPYYYVVKYKNYRFARPWKKQQYILQDITKMTYKEWKKFTSAMTEKAKIKFGY